MAKKKQTKKTRQRETLNLTVAAKKIAVAEFLDKYEKAALRASTRMRTLPRKMLPMSVLKNTKWWKKVRAIIKWLKAMNEQRKR